MHRDIKTTYLQRPHWSFFFAPAIAVFLAGCLSSVTNAASSGAGVAAAQAASQQKVGGATYVSSTVLLSRLTTVPIPDPSLNNMAAVDMTIPAGWKLQGIVTHPPCTPAPSPAFRAYSPDGLMQLRQEPVLGWSWAANAKGSQNGCADISGIISAADFLKYYLEATHGGFHVVGSMPVPAWYSKWAQGMAKNFNENDTHVGPMFQLQHSADTAALRVQVVNGSFLVEERLRAAVQCGVNDNPGPNAPPWMAKKHGSCFARVDVISAPQGKLDALVQLADSNELPHGVGRPEWQQPSLQQLSDKNRREGEAMLAAGRAQSQAFSRMMNNAFQQNMARSRAQHQAFMQQQEASFRSSMNNANAAMNARTTAASDWVDYALDQKTVTAAGGTVKVSSAYSQTWSNGQGQWYQTNGNTDPNGILQGNWTQTTVVHGNGQPK